MLSLITDEIMKLGRSHVVNLRWQLNPFSKPTLVFINYRDTNIFDYDSSSGPLQTTLKEEKTAYYKV